MLKIEEPVDASKAQGSVVNVHTEWDPLEEIIVGQAFDDCQFPTNDWVFHNAHINIPGEDPSNLPSGLLPPDVVRQAQEDLQALAEALEGLGVKVRRPEYVDFSKTCATPYWEADGFNTYCPRDTLLAVGNTVIEAPMALRSRQFEYYAYWQFMRECIQAGDRWISAPKPKLLPESFIIGEDGTVSLNELEPIFDAANVLRVGRDLLYQVSSSGNRLGGVWLQSVLGEGYKVHYTEVYSGSHIDSTFTPLRPGLLLANAERVNPENLPGMFKEWEVIYFSDIVPNPYTGYAYSSKWLGMNLLMVNPELAVVESTQQPLAAELRKHGIEVVLSPLRQCRTLGGGFHCVTLDTKRSGVLESYC